MVRTTFLGQCLSPGAIKFPRFPPLPVPEALQSQVRIQIQVPRIHMQFPAPKRRCVYIFVYSIKTPYLLSKTKERFPVDCALGYISEPGTDTFSYCTQKLHPIRLKLGKRKEAQLHACRLQSSLTDPWMKLPLVSSSPIHSPVQQLPADPRHQENR